MERNAYLKKLAAQTNETLDQAIAAGIDVSEFWRSLYVAQQTGATYEELFEEKEEQTDEPQN